MITAKKAYDIADEVRQLSEKDKAVVKESILEAARNGRHTKPQYRLLWKTKKDLQRCRTIVK